MRRNIAVAGALVLMISGFAAGLLLMRPAIAQAQSTNISQRNATTVHAQALDAANTRLVTFITGTDGTVSYKSSDNDGISWSDWTNIGSPAAGVTNPPTVVSNGVGRLNVFVLDHNNDIDYSTYNNGSWTGWQTFPGTGGGGTCNITPFTTHCFVFASDPTVASWGPGRMDLFIYAFDDNNNKVLLHTWADNYAWSSSSWDVLGSGLMQGNPSAVSWGLGRVDVFVRGGGDEMDHKWFDNGHWSSGWENLGGILKGSPSTLSWLPGFLAVFAYNSSGGLEENLYGQGFWSGWGDLDSHSIASDPAATNVGSNSIHVFARGLNNHLLHRHSSNGTWSGWQDIDPFQALPFNFSPAAASYVTSLPTPTPTPVPQPPRCGVGTGHPCPVEP